MNRLFQFIIRKMDARCRVWEAGLESGRRIPDDIQEYLDIPFQGAEGVPLAVDIFRAKTRDLRPLPVVVMIHGGGLMVGTRKEADMFQEIGDLYTALSFVSGMLAEYGGDPDQVTVVSESAGSFLSVYTVASLSSPALREAFGLPDGSLQVRALACFCGMFYAARRDLPGLFYPRYLVGKKRKDASFMRYMNPECSEVAGSLPPVFLAGSDADFLKGYTKRFAAALRSAGHSCRLVYYRDNKALTHSFPALKPDLPESREILDQLVEWIAENESAQA